MKTLVLLLISGLKCTTTGVNVFLTIPDEVGGVLSVCAGDIISIRCSHTNTDSGVTRWVLSPPVNCSETMGHFSPNDRQCGTSAFRLAGITPLAANVILNSTAIATANTTMSGTTVQCFDSAGIAPVTVGSVTLCIFGRDMSLSVTDTADKMLIEWHLTSSEYCRRNVNYTSTVTVTIESTDNLSHISLVTTVFGETRANVTGLIPNQVYTVQVSAEVSSCESLIATRKFTTSGTSTAATEVKTDSDSNLEVWLTNAVALLGAIIIVLIIVVTTIVSIVKHLSKNTESDANPQTGCHTETPTENQDDNEVYYSTISPRPQESDVNDIELMPNQVYGVVMEGTSITTQPNLVYGLSS